MSMYRILPFRYRTRTVCQRTYLNTCGCVMCPFYLECGQQCPVNCTYVIILTAKVPVGFQHLGKVLVFHAQESSTPHWGSLPCGSSYLQGSTFGSGHQSSYSTSDCTHSQSPHLSTFCCHHSTPTQWDCLHQHPAPVGQQQETSQGSPPHLASQEEAPG